MMMMSTNNLSSFGIERIVENGEYNKNVDADKNIDHNREQRRSGRTEEGKKESNGNLDLLATSIC